MPAFDLDIKPAIPSPSLAMSIISATPPPHEHHPPSSPSSTPKRKASSTNPDSPKKPRGLPKGIPAHKGEGSQGRATRPWRKEEVRALWDAMGFLPVKVKWDDVAEKVPGRGKLWRYDLLPKVQAFIDSLGD